MIELVIFDMDGLMFDTEILGLKAMRKATKKFGYELTNEFYTELVGSNGETAKRKIISHFGDDYPYEAIESLSGKYFRELIEKDGVPMKPGLTHLLEYLKEKKIQTCVASSSSRSTIMHHLKANHLEDDFAFLMAGDEVKETKPNPEIFLKVLKKTGVNPKNALVLEDSQNGIKASYQAGIPVICIPDLKVPEPAIAQLCEAILPSLNHVIDYLK